MRPCIYVISTPDRMHCSPPHSRLRALHVAACPETRHLVNEAFCAALKPGAILINTTRGSVVDEVALLQAVRE